MQVKFAAVLLEMCFSSWSFLLLLFSFHWFSFLFLFLKHQENPWEKHSYLYRFYYYFFSVLDQKQILSYGQYGFFPHVFWLIFHTLEISFFLYQERHYLCLNIALFLTQSACSVSYSYAWAVSVIALIAGIGFSSCPPQLQLVHKA